jgi:NAD(P)-dependent dehydrogenase (short-subunit alcohol dehydrogenase family)
MKNKSVVIVTGASRGLGAAIACWLGKAGAEVTLIARSEDKLVQIAEKVKRLGGKPLVYTTDISDPAAGRTAVEKTLSRFGRLDALVNKRDSLALWNGFPFQVSIRSFGYSPLPLALGAVLTLFIKTEARDRVFS